MNLVKHFVGQEVMELIPTGVGAVSLPATSCAMLPNAYLFNGLPYDCTVPGLYVFQAGSNIQCRIVAGSDVYALLSSISWHHVHGVDDESLAVNTQLLANAGMTHKWRLRCGYISDLVVWLLPQCGYVVRKVQALSIEPPNGVDDGHIMVEVQHSGKWKLWDMTNGCYWTNAQGLHLGLSEIITAGVGNCIQIRIDDADKAGSDLAGTFCMATYRDLVFRTEADKAAWFARIFQSWSVI